MRKSVEDQWRTANGNTATCRKRRRRNIYRVDTTKNPIHAVPERNQSQTMTHLCKTALIALVLPSLTGCLDAKEDTVSDLPPEHADKSLSLATLGTGCFWCTEALLETLDGVNSVVSGYSGGHKENPTYKEVCAETTGHAEVVQIAFDSKTISYEELLSYFWQAHDPTTLNRQGNDIGTQYRSIILYHDEKQKAAAEKSKAAAASSFKDPIVTEIAPFKKFYPAEDDHQDFYRNNPTQSYCYLVIRPKLQKFNKQKQADAKAD